MFVVCGEALWDLYGSEGEAGLSFDARIGGSPFNVAIGLARLEQGCALLTGLSRDRLGEKLAGALETESVSTAYLVRKDKPTTLSLVTVAPDGQPSYAFYGLGAADRSLEPSDLPELGPEVWGLHAGSFSLAVEPVGSTLLALHRRHAGHRLLTLDPNVRLNAEPDIELWRSRVAAFAAVSDLVKVSDEDLTLLYPGEDPATSAARWLDSGAGLIVVTRGGEGAEAYGTFGELSVPGRAVKVVDTVGAGDSFMAALIAGLAERGAKSREKLLALDRLEVEGLLGFAAEAASITCGRRGADPPKRAEIGAGAGRDA
ncbi:carbohydrate kinase [Afifella sp. IM 167]|nr:carbohydrate kinase [Afifella sp. IM 167]